MGYDLRPQTDVSDLGEALRGYGAISAHLSEHLKAREGNADARTVLAIECYPGVDEGEVLTGLVEPLEPTLVVRADDCMQDSASIQARIADHITDDRVFGVMSHYTIDQFIDGGKLEEARAHMDAAAGLVVAVGFGAARVCEEAGFAPDVLVYADLTRWEIQLRYRRGMENWMAGNAGEDALRKFKRGYFFEWRMADREKRRLSDRVDYLLDTNIAGDPRMVAGEPYRAALARVASRPFRLVPYFDASVWGGHWMQERFGLDPEAPNFGWAFDGVPEENSILLGFSGAQIEVPAVNVVFAHPDELLGPKVHARFGAEFPIRFDYLDTMGGGNLSLQVHPLVEYAQDRFGMHYTQDESYYILDSSEESCVYLGVKDGVDKDDLVADLKRAERGEAPFDDERFVNRFPVKKHDHVLIPAGTIHCSGPGTVVLEISATPYIFTFKLWDWGRVGLDGLPRPVHIGHGRQNIQMSRNMEFCEEHLLDRVDAPHGNLSDQEGVRSERTGLHELEFIETRRHWFRGSVRLECHGSVNMLNLVEGERAVVESEDGSFAPFEVSYGETFIVPESVGAYTVRNAGNPEREVALIQAFVRNL